MRNILFLKNFDVNRKHSEKKVVFITLRALCYDFKRNFLTFRHQVNRISFTCYTTYFVLLTGFHGNGLYFLKINFDFEISSIS